MALTDKEELEMLELEREQAFASTPGGAATGNPSIQAQGRKALRSDVNASPFAAIGGAGVAGGALGAFSKEILTGTGNVIGGIPYPVTQRLGGSLKAAGQIIGAGGRAAPAILGAASGIGGETAGQIADMTQTGQEHPAVGEAARIVGGGLTPETITLGKEVLKRYVATPALSLFSKGKKELALAVLGKLDEAPQLLSEQERKFLESEVAAVRGGAKSDTSLERVGSIMGAEGERVMGLADVQMVNAVRKAGAVGGAGGYPATSPTLADIGGGLRSTITKRNEAALAARKEQFAQNEKLRDQIVASQEQSGRFITSVPEYQQLVASLNGELIPGKRSPSVQAGYQKILDEIQIADGQVSFQALDDVRRKLGDAFRGKPAEGYDALGEALAKDLYGKVSEIQKKYAGPAQARLLDDYAEATEGLQVFSSKAGKKATALDQYRDEQYATDASALPSSYFKTRASVQALKELTGNEKQVQSAALDFADKQLSGKSAKEAREWVGKNAEWLSETGPTRMLVMKYVDRLEDAERSLINAENFASQAAKDKTMLQGRSLPAQRAVDLIKSGDIELWGKVLPVIQQSPQAKKAMVDAVRQVVADQATSKGTENLFSRSIRPFIEQSGIGSKQEMDFIAQKLRSIQDLKVPEPEKLGMARRILLQASSGWTAGALSRAGVQSYQWAVPE